MYLLLFRYPADKNRRFRCGKSDLCISVEYLCDGVSDCNIVNNNDDEILCPWRQTTGENERKRNFVCEDGVVLDLSWRCDGESDCTQGEDEYSCYLRDPPSTNRVPSLSNSVLRDIIVYPYDIFSHDDRENTSPANHLSYLQKTIA